MNTKVIIRILLGVAVVFMAYICVNSVVTPIQFEEARVQREVKVINNLVSLRTAEAQFRLDKGYFTADLDSLIEYLNDGIPVWQLRNGEWNNDHYFRGCHPRLQPSAYSWIGKPNADCYHDRLHSGRSK